MKQVGRTHKNVEEVLEHENIKEAWQAVVATREKEIPEVQATHETAGSGSGDEEAVGTDEAGIRRPPTAFSEGSPPTGGRWPT